MVLTAEQRPVLGPDPAGPPRDPRGFAGPALAAGFGVAVGSGVGVLGVVPDGQDSARAPGLPGQLTVAGPTPEPGGAREGMVGEVRDDGPGRA
jgi:hypothetical protein